MGDRTGCGLTELAILEALSAATGGRPRAHVVCTKAVAAIEERIGLGPRYGYEVLLDLARPWIVPVPTVSVVGNKGDRDFPEASGPEYTECRPSHAGQIVLDAEARRLAPVPVGVINGTTYRGGMQPPLEPLRVLAALRGLLEAAARSAAAARAPSAVSFTAGRPSFRSAIAARYASSPLPLYAMHPGSAARTRCGTR